MKMDSDAKTLKAAALEKGDHSLLCTKNIGGQMFLMLASELESTNLEDSCTSDESDSEPDLDTKITVSLLDENGQEVEEVPFKENLSHSTRVSVPDILKNLPATPEYIPNPVSKISTFALPTTTSSATIETMTNSIKLLPVTSSSRSAPHGTLIIKTTMPLSSLNLKSLLYSAGSLSNIVPKTQHQGTIKTPETIIASKDVSTAQTHLSSYNNTQAFSSSTPTVSLLSQKPITATTNFISAPISSVNKINSSLSNKVLLPGHSLSLSGSSSVIPVSVCTTSKLAQALTTPITTTTASINQFIQSFPISSANVIKSVNPVLDTGQLVPKVEIPNTNLVGTFMPSSVASQTSLSSNVQSKTLPNDQLGQLVSLVMPNNSNSLQIASPLFISTTGSNTSSTNTVMKKPIVHTGFVPTKLLSNIKQEPIEMIATNNVTSTALPLTSSVSTSILAPMNNVSMVQNTLQPTSLLTSPISKLLTCVKKIDPDLFSSGASVPTVITTSPVLSTTSPTTPVSFSSSPTILTIPDSSSPSGSLMVKILPNSAPSATEIISALPPVRSVSSVTEARNSTVYTVSASNVSKQDVHSTETNNTKDKLKQGQVYHNIRINNSLPAFTAGDSLTNLPGSKAAVSVNNPIKTNNVKSIWLMTPSEASTIFSPTSTNSVASISDSDSLNQDTNDSLQKVSPVTKMCQSDSTQPAPVIILLKPLISNSASVTTGTISSASSTSVTSTSSLNGDNLALKANQEQTCPVKVDDTVQFLKLGTLANPETFVKTDSVVTGAKIVKTEVKADDSNKTDNHTLLKVPASLMNDTNSKPIKVNPISSCSNYFKLLDSSNNAANIVKLKQASQVNVNTIVNNSNLIKIPTTVINGRHVITLPTQAQAPSIPVATLPNLAPSSSSQFVTLTSKPTSQPVLNFTSQTPTGTQLVPLTNQQATGAQLVKLASEAPTGTSLVPLTNQQATGTQLVKLASEPPTGTPLVPLTNQAATGTQLVKLTREAPTGTQLVPLTNQAPTGTQLVKLTSEAPTDTQLVPLTNQPATGSQLVKLTSEAPTGTQLVPLTNQPATGSQLVKLTSEAPTGTQLAPLTNQATTGTQLVKLTSEAPTGTQLVPLTSQATAGTQLVKLTSEAPTGTQLVKLASQALTSTQLVPLTSEAPAGTQLVKLTSQAPSAQLVKLACQAPTGTQLVKLANQPPTGTQIVKLSSQASTGTQLVKLNNPSPTSTQLVSLTSQAPTGTQLVSLTSQAPTGTQLVSLTSQAPTGTQLVSLTSQAPTGTQLVSLSSQAPTGTQLVKLTSQAPTAPQLVKLASQATNPQLVKLASQAPTAPQVVTLPNQTQTGTQFVSLTSQATTGTQLVKLTCQAPTGTQLVTLPSQAPTGPQLVKLTSQVPTGTQLITLTNPVTTTPRVVSLTSQASRNTQFVKLTSQSPTGPQVVTLTGQAPVGSQLVTLTNQTLTGPRVVELAGQPPTGTQLVTLTNQTPTGPRVVELTSHTPTRPQFATLTTQASSGAQLVTLNSQTPTNSQFVSLINQATSNQQFVRISNQNLPGSQIVKLPNQTLTGTQLIKLPAQVTPGMKLPTQSLTGTQVVRLNTVKSTPSNVKLMPLPNSSRMHLNQLVKMSTNLLSKSESNNTNGQLFTTKSTDMSNSSDAALNALGCDISQKLKKGEQCAFVVTRKTGPSSMPILNTTTTSSLQKIVPMQSLLQPQLIPQKLTPKSLLQLDPLLSQKSMETQTKIDTAEDPPMTLKIDSIFSLKDDGNKGLDYWETNDSQGNDQSEIKCDSTIGSGSQNSSPQKDVKPSQLQHKVFLSEKDMKVLPSPQSKPIVYARLNKPKLVSKTSPTSQKVYKIHDLSNCFNISQRKRLLEIGRTLRPEKTLSIIKKAYKARPCPIKARLHIDELKMKKYAFLQPRVMLPQLFIPARMKSVRASRLPFETRKSLKCQANCIHKVRISCPVSLLPSSTSPPVLNGKNMTSSTGQPFMYVKVEGKNLMPYFNNSSAKSYHVLKDNSNVSASISSVAPQNLLLKQENQVTNNPLRQILPAIAKKESAQNLNELSTNKDDTLNCLQLACGIIQDNTLKRKSSLSQNYDWRGEDQADSDWSMALEMQYLSHKVKKKKKLPEEASI